VTRAPTALRARPRACRGSLRRLCRSVIGSENAAFQLAVVSVSFRCRDRRRIASAHAQSAARDRGDHAFLDGLGVSDVLEFADELEALLGAVMQRLPTVQRFPE
jgi:hypothetical protein